MITNKRYQTLLMLATTGKPLNKDATEEEKKFYKECKRDYKVMLETAKKHGIKNPIMEIPFEVDFQRDGQKVSNKRSWTSWKENLMLRVFL